MIVSIITPTYNRAHLLPRLYQSLCRQTYSDFEWIIVDDGSDDNTQNTVNSFIDRHHLDIKYIKKANGGKHTAVNRGIEEASGELSFIADSDDWLPSTSVEKVVLTYDAIRGNKEYAGVCGLDGYPDGKVIGSGLPEKIIDASYLEIRDKFGITGDMKEVYLTSVLREFPFPEIDGERFCSEALIWNRIASKYKLRFFNEIIYYAEYQGDGITSSITKARMKSPIATMMTYSEWICYNIPIGRKIKYAINYWRFAFCTKNRNIKIAPWAKMLMPLGWFIHNLDKRKCKL